MLYSIIDTKKGEEQGLQALTHRTLCNGEKMIVNENELMKLGEYIAETAKLLGGKLMTRSELQNETKKIKNYE